jgi:hypothetical protein
MYKDDPWAWANEQPMAAPLSGASIQPSQAVSPQISQAPPGLIEGTIKPMIVGKAINKGMEAATPYAESALASAKGALFPTAATAAPAVAAPMAGAAMAPTAAATVASAAAPAAAGAGAGAMAALPAMGPLGWAGMAYLTGKALKIF